MTTPPALPRVLGFTDVFSLLVGTVIGSGIFIVSATMAAAVGSPVLMMSVWIVGGVLSLFGALALSELAAAYPESGGIYVYLREAYGPLVAFLFGWTEFLVIESGSLATLASAFSTKYLTFFVPLDATQMKIVSVAMLVALAAVNVLGVRLGALVQRFFTVLKIAAILGVILTILIVADGDSSHYVAPPSPPWSLSLLTQFGVALVASLWAYKGWELVTFAAGEVRNPQRNLPLGLLAGTAVVVLLYVAANVAYLYVLPIDAIARSARIAADAMQAGVGPVGAAIVAGIVLVSITGALNGNILTAPRIFFAMARDGIFFRRMADVHPRFVTPHVSIIVLTIWAAILTMTGTFEQLATYVVFGVWIFLGLTAAAVIVLRRTQPDRPRPYRTWGYPVTPILFVLASLFISVNTLMAQFWNAVTGLGLIALGVPAYYFWRASGRTAAR
jgi:basic amino acid/polyamine antiporter, APA family